MLPGSHTFMLVGDMVVGELLVREKGAKDEVEVGEGVGFEIEVGGMLTGAEVEEGKALEGVLEG